MFDIANQYLWQGVTGGILPLILFVASIAYCFRAIAESVAEARNRPFAQRIMFWCLGAALFSQSVNFLSVSYWDQNIVNWYLLLAMISSGSVLRFRPKPAHPTHLNWIPDGSEMEPQLREEVSS